MTLVLGVLVSTLVLFPTRWTPLASASIRLQAQVARALDAAHLTWNRHLALSAQATALEQTEHEVEALRTEVTRLRAVEREHARLTELLELSHRDVMSGALSGRVVARHHTGRRVIRLDIGSNRGVTPGMAVVGARGVVGQVVQTGPDWSEAISIVDPTHGLPARLVDGAHGTIRGTGDALRLDHILAQDVAHIESLPGTLVVSSGEGGVFPPGLPVGHVGHVEPSSWGPFLSIEVHPLAAPSLLDEVLIVGTPPVPLVGAPPPTHDEEGSTR